MSFGVVTEVGAGLARHMHANDMVRLPRHLSQPPLPTGRLRGAAGSCWHPQYDAHKMIIYAGRPFGNLTPTPHK